MGTFVNRRNRTVLKTRKIKTSVVCFKRATEHFLHNILVVFRVDFVFAPLEVDLEYEEVFMFLRASLRERLGLGLGTKHVLLVVLICFFVLLSQVHTKFHCRQAHAPGSDPSCVTFSYDGVTLASRGGQTSHFRFSKKHNISSTINSE